MKNKTNYLVLENDFKLSEELSDYLQDLENVSTTILCMMHNRTSEEVMEAFTNNEIVLFQPTMIEYGQYNLMLMLMWNLIQAKKLGIKEVHIFTRRPELKEELRELWEERRKYLDEVLKHVTIYQIDSFTDEKIKINI